MTPILLIHQGALGDLILSLPALYALRVFSPQASWTMAGNPDTLSLLKDRFYVQKVVSIHGREWAALMDEDLNLPEPFQQFLASFDQAYLFAKHKPQAMIRGLNRAGLIKTIWLPSLPDEGQPFSLTARQKEILVSHHLPWAETDKTIFPSPEDLEEGRDYLARLGGQGPWLAIHPGSGSPHKNWPWERFRETAQAISRQSRLRPVFIIGPVEKDTFPEMAEKMSLLGFPVLRDVPLTILTGVLSHCAGYLGNDSGVSHLAAALGIPAVILFGPTDPEIWGPRGKKVMILRPENPCAPCSLEAARTCPEKVCWDSLSVRQVLDRIFSSFQT